MAAAFAGVVMLVLGIIASAWHSSVQGSCRIAPVAVDFGALPKADGFWSHEFNLEGLQKIKVGRGPEDVAIDSQGRAYTGVEGWIKRIGVDGKVENHTFVGGRPLGIALNLGEEIFFTDPALGLFKVSSDGVVHKLFPNEDDTIDTSFLNGVEVARDGTVYFTDVSMNFGFAQYPLIFLDGRATGRLLKYDPLTRSSSVLVAGLGFANGVALSEDEDFILISETSRARVVRYWLKGEKEGILDTFLDELPGYPDNVRRIENGNFYIGLLGQRTVLSDWIMKTPSVRCLVSPSFILTWMESVSNTGRLIVAGPDGKLLTKYEDPTGKLINRVSGGIRAGSYVYFNGLSSEFISRLKV